MPVGRCVAPAKELAEGCAILKVPEDKVVVDRRGAVFARPIETERKYGLHEHTIDEELRTLCNRHLFATPEPELESEEWKEFLKQVKLLSRQIGRVPRCKFSELLKTKSGRKMRRFWGGIQKYLEEGVSAKDSKITEMQKLEMYDVTKIEGKEDRGIQFRSTVYNAALASHLWNIEHRLIHLHDGPHRMVMKGLKPDDRMRHIACGTENMKKPVFFQLDHSRFDAHVNEHLLRAEHSVYAYCRKRNPEMMRLLKMQRKNIGRSFGGIVYKMKAKRMSGDVNTSLGNTILNLCMLRSWLSFNEVEGRIFLDGDDSVVIVEAEDVEKLGSFEDYFLKLGMKTEGSTTEDLWQVEFCQSRPCWIGGTVKAVRDPLKVISTIGVTAGSHETKEMKRVVAATCLCEDAINGPSCPVIAPFLRRVYERVEHVDPQAGENIRWKVENGNIDIHEHEIGPASVTEEDRYWFFRTWGITPGEQLMMENQLIEFNPTTVANEDKKLKKPKEMEYPVDWDWGFCVRGCECDDCPTVTEERVVDCVSRYL